MRRVVAALSLMLLSGCGSCLEDKKIPETEQPTPTIKTITKTTEGGAKRPVLVGEGVRFAGAVPNEAGADGGN